MEHLDILAAFALLGGFLTIFSFLWKINKTIETVFRRFDEHKLSVEQKLEKLKKEICDAYVTKDICKVVHEQGEKNHLRVEKKLDDLTKEVFAKFEIINQNLLTLIQNGKNGNHN